MSSPNIASDIKRLSIEYCQKHNVVIHYMETDKDNIHYMIETTPNINLSNIVKTMKSYITYHIWEKYSAYLSKCFWKERTFFSDGYFISSIGNVSQETLKLVDKNFKSFFKLLNQKKNKEYENKINIPKYRKHTNKFILVFNTSTLSKTDNSFKIPNSYKF